MKNFRAIRIAVILSLIVTTTMQSFVGVAAAAQCPDVACASSSELGFICDGCDRCSVGSEGELCCCCKPKPNGKQPADCPHKSRPIDGEQTVPEVAATLGICLCGLSSPPIDRGQDRSRITEQVEQQECDLSAICDVLSLQPPRLAVSSPHITFDIGSLPRFSQRHLCVWRI